MARPRLSAAALLCVTALCAGLATLLQIDANMLALLPEDDPTAEAIRTLNEEEGGTNLLTIFARSDDDAALEAHLARLADRLGELEEVEYALYDLDPDLAFRLGLLQLDTAQLQALRARLQGAVAMGPAAANPFLASRLLDLGPLAAQLGSAERTALFPPEDGVARLVVRPVGIAHDRTFVQPFMEKVEAIIAEEHEADPTVEVFWLGGAYRHSLEDVANIGRDLQGTAAVSLFLVLALIAAAFRDLRAILLIFVPLILANVWTSGMAGLLVGSLNTFTSFFPAVLLGLGVDFSIHLYSRYREEAAAGLELHDAVVAAWDKVGPPSATAALTSAGGFCALWAAGFQGFQQLGTILAGGVLLCLVAVLVTLPLLIQWREGGRAPAPKPSAPPPPSTSAQAAPSWAPLTLGAMAVLTVGAATLLPRVEFQYDLSELRPASLSYDQLADDDRKAAEKSYSPVVLSYDSPAALAEAHTRLTALQQDGALTHVTGVLSLHSALPVDQADKVAVLSDIATLARTSDLAYLPPAVQQNLARIATIQPRVLTREDLPTSLLHMLGADAGKNRILLMTGGNMWDVRTNVDLYEVVQEHAPDASAAGEYLALAVLYNLMQSDLAMVSGIALLTVLLMTWFDLRNLGQALFAVAALSTGMAWAGAALVLFDIKLSLVNFVGIPILMGIGVDVVIHLLHRIRDEGRGRVRYALSTTGWASGLSTATTVFSFGALSVASAQGVSSLGLLIVVGLTLVSALALAVVPLGFLSWWRLRG